jgi:hypothetical protein
MQKLKEPERTNCTPFYRTYIMKTLSYDGVRKELDKPVGNKKASDS